MRDEKPENKEFEHGNERAQTSRPQKTDSYSRSTPILLESYSGPTRVLLGSYSGAALENPKKTGECVMFSIREIFFRQERPRHKH